MYRRVHTIRKQQKAARNSIFTTHVISEIIDRQIPAQTYTYTPPIPPHCCKIYIYVLCYIGSFFSKICTASSYYNVFITIIIIRIITIIIVGTTTCERHRSSVNKMTRETGPVKFSTAPSPNLVRNAHCSCIIIILYITHVHILYRFVLLQRSLYVYTVL